MPVVASTVSRPWERWSNPAGPSAATCSATAQRSSDLAEAEARWAARSVRNARSARPTMTASSTSSGVRSDETEPWWK